MFGIPKLLSRLRIRTQPKSSKPDKPLPLGLSRDQLEAIQDLTAETHYKHYLAALEALYEINVSAMLRMLPHDAYLFQCGVCFALEQVAALPGDLTLKLRETDARHTAATESILADTGERAFVNTPFWDAYQRLGRQPRKYGGPGVPVPGQRNGPSVPPGENGR